MSEPLFCIYITGMDELIPVRDMAEAVRAAAYLNAEYLHLNTQLSNSGDTATPYCFAAPALWPFSYDEHGKCLDEMMTRAKEQRCPHWMCG